MIDGISELRDDLGAARFTVDSLQELWGDDAEAALGRGHRLPALRALGSRAESALSSLARLFVLGEAVGLQDLEKALPTLGVTGAQRLGLVERLDGCARPLLDLRPYSFFDESGAAQWWIASDLGELTLGAALPEQHVLGVGGASLTLAGLQLPSRTGSVLDLGCGSGIQALHASRYAERVVATDISPRAVEMTAFNAELNGVAIETRTGSLFEPVEGERFDRVISNPPFVITPRVADMPSYDYRDGGLVGDGIVEAVVRGLPHVLSDGGTAQLLGNWEYRAGEDGLDRVRSWVRDSGLDAWVIERESLAPSHYAETWIRDGGTRQGSDEFARLHSLWLDDFAEREVTGIGFGYLLLRKPSRGRPTLHRFERLSQAIGGAQGGLGTHLIAALKGHDFHAPLDDAELLSRRLIVAGDVTEERHFWPGDEHPAAIDLRQGGGFARTVTADTALAGFVGACDGELTVGQILGALADLLTVPQDALVESVLPRVRQLLDDAMLVPAEATG